VHLAAKVSLAGAPAEFEAVNVGGTASLIAAMERAGVPRLVFVSSPSVAHAGASIVGDDALPADPVHARGDYARTKARAELLALGADSEKLRVVAVRPHLVWGPGDAQLTERIVERARAGRLPLLDRGAALIDTTYVDNAAAAIAAALERVDAVHGNAYVITNGEPRPVAEILAGICAAAGVSAPSWRVPAGVARAAGSLIEAVWRVKPGADEPPMTRFLAEQLSTAHWFDQRRTRAELQWEPAVSLDEGLRRLAEHYSRS
jgi:nucleoside-diphosphate-sugar epimerase